MLSMEASMGKLSQALQELVTSLEVMSIAIKGLSCQTVPEADIMPVIQNEKGVLEILDQNPFLEELK